MEIERKFLVKQMPDLSGLTSIHHERYYLKRGDGIEERIQKKGDRYEYEYKQEVSALERTKIVKEITKEEFEASKSKASEALIRESYKLSNGVSLKIYHGRFEGLVRAEIEFDSVTSAKAYKPESWMGPEITESPLGRDGKLLDLNDEEFAGLLKQME